MPILDYLTPGPPVSFYRRVTIWLRTPRGYLTVAIAAAAILSLLGYMVRPRIIIDPIAPRVCTDDDGQTWFRDFSYQPPPFPHNGKEAVWCYVVRCPGSQPFVAYMERFTPEAHALFRDYIRAGKRPPMSSQVVGLDNVEVKRPGDAHWTKLSADHDILDRISRPRCPHNNPAHQSQMEVLP